MSERAPRKVVAVHEGFGERGGEYWSLALECGHAMWIRKSRMPVVKPEVDCLLCGRRGWSRKELKAGTRELRG